MHSAIRRTRVVALLAMLLLPATVSSDPIAFAIRGDTFVQIRNFTTIPPEIVRESTQVDEVFGADDLALISSSLTGSGATAGYTGDALARITDAVIGAYATATSPGTALVSIISSGYGGYIDYFTVLLPEGSFVPMLFTLAHSYTMAITGGACGTVTAGVQVGIDDSFVGGLLYLDSSCQAGSLTTETELMVPTGVPFRVLYEMSATASAGLAGTATVDALNSLRLFADPIGDYRYATTSGKSFVSSPTPVPEPVSLLTLGTGLVILASRSRRRR